MSKLNVMRTLTTTAVAGLLALSGFAALAQDRGHHHGPAMMEGHVERMLESVDASDAQRAQIKQIMQAARADLKGQMDAGRKLQEQTLALYAAPNIDAAAIETQRQQAQAQREVASKRMSQAMIEAARVLTPEQRAKFAEKMKKRQSRMMEHMKDRAAKHAS
jgi:Spy/CpxP family protein refolding chaperone